MKLTLKGVIFNMDENNPHIIILCLNHSSIYDPFELDIECTSPHDASIIHFACADRQ